MVTIIIENTNNRQQFEVSKDQSLLAGSERCLPQAIPHGCRGGGCGRCKVRILEGDYLSMRMSKAHVSDSQAYVGYALACRVYPLTDLRIEVANQD